VVLAEVAALDVDDPVVRAIQQSHWMQVVSKRFIERNYMTKSLLDLSKLRRIVAN
jgi:hypothetical protein